MNLFAFLPMLMLITRHSFALDTTWWKNTIIYETFIWSFKDSNGDGVGDIRGIIEKIDHFVDLRVDTIYITPFYKSPMMDVGYDISNFIEIEPLFGTMGDFERLMAVARERSIKVIGDLVINHSSDEHPWFQKSIEQIEPYKDFYVWADPKGYDANGKPKPPNNWMSLFGGSGWQWNDKRRQFYLHQFNKKQPDFNLRNEDLKTEIKKIVKFWFDKGLSGFRLDATKHYVEDRFLRDEPVINANKPVTEYKDLKHIHTVDLWESYEFIHDIREFVDYYNKHEGNTHERILIVEAYTSLNKTFKYYGTKDYHIAHFPFDFHFAKFEGVVPAQEYNYKITRWLDNMPAGATPNWVAENHDRRRIGNRLGEQYMDIVTITIMTLPGVACIYYGQEIGMQNHVVRKDQGKDPNNDGFSGATRDGQRLPMQWDSSINAGFTTNLQPWLPVNPDYWKVNVQIEKSRKYSRYQMFKTLAALRKSKTLKYGTFEPFILSKSFQMGTETEMFDLHEAIPNLPSVLEIVTASQNAGYLQGSVIQGIPKFPKFFIMRPNSAVVLKDKKLAQ